MPRVRDLLYRFRPSGAPGSPARPGVPADRAHDLAEELEPVFAALAPTFLECDGITEAGRRRADAVRASYAAQAEGLRSTTAQRTAVERTRATTSARAARAPDTAEIDAAVEAGIAALRSRVERELPDVRRRVAASVEALLETSP